MIEKDREKTGRRPGEDREKTGRKPGERECMEKSKKSLVYLVFLNFLNGLGIYLFLTVMQILIYKTTNSVRNISIFIALFTIPKVCFSAILGNIMAKYSMKCMMLFSQLGIAGLCFLCVKSRIEIILSVSFFFSGFFTHFFSDNS
ncbi:hypothetical protein FUSO5_05320 [Fusobacterium necrophorum BFTR-1]|nr:hypothetical protein FUSO5_05320 [Fusobacterium necrophorum BFTR-1]